MKPFRPADFWDRQAQRYNAQPIADEKSYAKTLERVGSHLEPHHRVFEVGGGTGTTAIKLATHVGEILCTDVSPAMVAIATEKAQQAGVDNVRFACAALDDEQLPVEGFDVVMAFNFLHLLLDTESAIRRMSLLLKPGGLLITKTPCLGELSIVLPWVVGFLRSLGKAPLVSFFRCAFLLETVTAAGLVVLQSERIPAGKANLFVVARKPPASS